MTYIILGGLGLVAYVVCSTLWDIRKILRVQNQLIESVNLNNLKEEKDGC